VQSFVARRAATSCDEKPRRRRRRRGFIDEASGELSRTGTLTPSLLSL